MATPAPKKSKNSSGWNPLALIQDWIAKLFSMLVMLKDRVTGKTVTKKAKNLGETVSQQQGMVKEAEKAFASDMQRAERNLDETKRSMEAHKMALNMGPAPTATEQAKMNTGTDYEAKVAESTQPLNEEDVNGQEGNKANNSKNDEPDIPNAQESDADLFHDVLMSTKGLGAIRAIGGLETEGKTINPFDIDQWLTPNVINAKSDSLKNKIIEQLIDADGSARAIDPDQKTIVKGLLFEKLAGTLGESIPTENSEASQRQLTTALAYLWYEASQLADELIEIAQEEGAPEERHTRVLKSHDNAFSTSQGTVRLDSLGDFVKEHSGVDDEGSIVTVANDESPAELFRRQALKMWMEGARKSYENDLSNGHLALHEAPMTDPQGNTTVYQWATQQQGNKENSFNAEAGDQSVIEDHEIQEEWLRKHRKEPANNDEYDDIRRTNAEEVDAQETTDVGQRADEPPFGKKTKPAEQGGYKSSMKEQTFGEVSGDIPNHETSDIQAPLEEDISKDKVFKGPTYGDMKSVPGSNGLSI